MHHDELVSLDHGESTARVLRDPSSGGDAVDPGVAERVAPRDLRNNRLAADERDDRGHAPCGRSRNAGRHARQTGGCKHEREWQRRHEMPAGAEQIVRRQPCRQKKSHRYDDSPQARISHGDRASHDEKWNDRQMYDADGEVTQLAPGAADHETVEHLCRGVRAKVLDDAGAGRVGRPQVVLRVHEEPGVLAVRERTAKREQPLRGDRRRKNQRDGEEPRRRLEGRSHTEHRREHSRADERDDDGGWVEPRRETGERGADRERFVSASGREKGCNDTCQNERDGRLRKRRGRHAHQRLRKRHRDDGPCARGRRQHLARHDCGRHDDQGADEATGQPRDIHLRHRRGAPERCDERHQHQRPADRVALDRHDMALRDFDRFTQVGERIEQQRRAERRGGDSHEQCGDRQRRDACGFVPQVHTAAIDRLSCTHGNRILSSIHSRNRMASRYRIFSMRITSTHSPSSIPISR